MKSQPIQCNREHCARALLDHYGNLFRRAKLRELEQKQFIGPGGRMYSVGPTLRIIAEELKGRGSETIYPHEQAAINLLNIVVQQPEWDTPEAQEETQ